MNRIKEFRVRSGYSQAQLAALCHVAQGTISGWELGKYEPDYSSLEKLAKLFDTTVDELFNVDGSTDNQQQEIDISGYHFPAEALQVAQKYSLLNPSAKAVIRSILEFELRQDTYMNAEINKLQQQLNTQKQIHESEMETARIQMIRLNAELKAAQAEEQEGEE